MVLKVFIIVYIIILSSKCYGENEQPDISQLNSDEQIYSNHKYFDLNSIDSIQKYEPGRVQIKVYRGPDMYYNDEKFAAHGYWVKQPSEDY